MAGTGQGIELVSTALRAQGKARARRGGEAEAGPRQICVMRLSVDLFLFRYFVNED